MLGRFFLLSAVAFFALGGQQSLFAQVQMGVEWAAVEIESSPIPHSDDWQVIEFISDKEQVQILRLGSAQMAFVNEVPVANSVNPVLVRKGQNTLMVKSKLPAKDQVKWEQPIAPLFFDVADVQTVAWNPRLKGGTQEILVVNASLQRVPLLYLICGGVGPFQRKRVPTLQGMPPLSVTRVSLPLVAKSENPDGVRPETYPLMLSIAGLVDAEPLAQFIRIPSREPWPSDWEDPYDPVDRPQRFLSELKAEGTIISPPLGPESPFFANVEQLKPGVNYSLSSHPLNAVVSSVGRKDMEVLQLTLNPKVQLMNIRLDPVSVIDQIFLAHEQDQQTWSRADLGDLFWAEWDGKQWSLHNHGVPAIHKGVHRTGPVSSALPGAVWIYGTAGSAEENAQILRKLRLDSGRWLRADAENKLDLISDREFLRKDRPQDFSNRNLVLVGNADTNLAWSALAAKDMPFRFKRGEIGVGSRNVKADDGCGALLQPHPSDPYRLILFLGDTGVPGSLRSYGTDPSAMTRQDYAVKFPKSGQFPTSQRSGCFDHRWRFPEQPDVAEIR